MSLEEFLQNLTLEEIEKLKELKLSRNKIYNFSNVDFETLDKLFLIEANKKNTKAFEKWFRDKSTIKEEDTIFLEKLLEREKIFIETYKEEDSYKYYVSENFDSTKIEDLKGIFRNLLYVKKEIIELVKNLEKTTKSSFF